MKRLLPLCMVLVGCQVPQPAPSTPPLPQGSLSVKLLWPKRTIQAIPLSTQTIRLRVLKNGTLLHELPLSRPADNGDSLVAQASMQLDASSGLTVQAEAFRSSPVGSADVPMASASVNGVAVVANQKTPVQLVLVPVFVPTLTGFFPTNGGPGVEVTLTGSFGDSGYYGLSVGGVRGSGRASGSAIVASVPQGAVTGAVLAFADGIPSAPGATFSVLKALNLVSQSQTVSVGATVSFSVPSGIDTANQTISNPTLTGWEVVDPASMSFPSPATSQVGSITSSGLFTAQATGTAWVRIWSGSLSATASVTVGP